CPADLLTRQQLTKIQGYRIACQCGVRGCVFNALTGTLLEGAHRRPSQILWILHGITQGTPTAQMARELRCERR
ncbi:MAG: hypothetical protein ACM35G_06870, partial [Planctomycetaceae bacterium]